MDKRQIEHEARLLLRGIYARRGIYWPDREPHVFEMIDPAVGAKVLGVELRYVERLTIPIPGTSTEPGGIIDRARKTIVVAERFGIQVARFTAAHELGHWLLHPRQTRLHRDIPIGGLDRNVRSPAEREADYFAACFLMPEKTVRDLFKDMFLTQGPFIFNEATAFHLRPYDIDALLYPEADDSMDRAVTLATAKAFNGRHFEKSLAEMFQVSVATMAIRLAELGLVHNYP